MPDDAATLPTAGLLRRLGAMFYDGLLLIALFMTLTAILLVLTGGEAIDGPLLPWYRLFLLLTGASFFALFWRFGGQTLGMRAWRVQVRGPAGALGWREAWLRCAAALLSWLVLGLGFLWSLVDRDGLAWHDRLSGTRLIVVPK